MFSYSNENDVKEIFCHSNAKGTNKIRHRRNARRCARERAKFGLSGYDCYCFDISFPRMMVSFADNYIHECEKTFKKINVCERVDGLLQVKMNTLDEDIDKMVRMRNAFYRSLHPTMNVQNPFEHDFRKVFLEKDKEYTNMSENDKRTLKENYYKKLDEQISVSQKYAKKGLDLFVEIYKEFWLL